MACRGKNTVLQVKIKGRIHTLCWHIECQYAGLFPNTVFNIEIKRSVSTLILRRAVTVKLDVSILYVKGEILASEGCASRNDKRRRKRCLISSLGIGNRASNVESATVTNNKATRASNLQASALTDVNRCADVLNTKVSRLSDTLERNRTSSSDDTHLLTITIKDNTCRNNNILCNISKKNDFVTSLSRSNRFSE